jgi:hypothetical protein
MYSTVRKEKGRTREGGDKKVEKRERKFRGLRQINKKSSTQMFKLANKITEINKEQKQREREKGSKNTKPKYSKKKWEQRGR